MSDRTEKLRALNATLVTTAAKLIRASYDDDVERMAAALGNGSMAVKGTSDRLRNLLDAEQDETADAPCICGHARIDHIREVGACRPGFVCPAGCGYYTPPAPVPDPSLNTLTVDSEASVTVPDDEAERAARLIASGWYGTDWDDVDPDDAALCFREGREMLAGLRDLGWVSPEDHAAAVAEAVRATGERIAEALYGDGYLSRWCCASRAARIAREVAAGGGE